MLRYTFHTMHNHIDAASKEAAIAEYTKQLVITETKIPQKAVLLCSVTPTPGPNNMYAAHAYLDNELIAQVEAPSPERALRALGYNNPAAHTCRTYQSRFGTMWELRLKSATPA